MTRAEEAEIRDLFKDHMATICKSLLRSPDHEELLWSNESGKETIHYSLLHGVLRIDSSFGFTASMFKTSWDSTWGLRRVSELTPTEFKDHCTSIYEVNPRKTSFDARRARNCVLRALQKQMEEEARGIPGWEISQESCELFVSRLRETLATDPGLLTSKEEWNEWLEDHAVDFMGPNWMEFIGDSYKSDWILEVHHLGLKMAMEQLEKQ